PIMMARRFQGPIAVARRRIDAIRLLERHGRLDAVVLDDAFQHIRLARDFDLLVLNTDRAFGNGWLLPAGPMRERPGAVRRADAIVLIERGDGLGAESQVSRARVFHAAIRPHSLVHPELGQWREVPLAIHGRRVLAVSGLANPNGFYEMIRAQDADLVGVLEYPDHHRYTQADWQNVASAARDADIVITTEKDLVKLERFPFARDSLYALRLEVTMDEQESARLLDMIAGAAQTPRQAALA
ncbi:MAG: tetraacyldisaccharide 4'-kinase, partial [Candidatus Binataceae bacterium]